ncbi:MAG: TOTE conflict system archaeo-eukaryotic primase domain-containing protein, partial [Cyanobium sp.]
MADAKPSDLDRLRRENARLIGLLEAHGIAWRTGEPAPTEPAPFVEVDPAKGPSSTQEKVTLFRSLFRGRDDVYALRWQSSSGRSGYAPACANEWRPGLCEKPRISCRDCNHRELLPLSDAAIYGHLAGEHTIGLYPLLENDHCHLLAVDFDERDWRDDARAFLRSCRQLAVPAALEISRSGEGAHVWVFFEEAVSAREARQLGAALISHTCNATRQLQLSSYDRLFPNQDTLPKGGFGNLIALPLQKEARQRGCSVFVDDNLQPYPDQWAYLASLQRLSLTALQTVIQNVTGGGHPVDLADRVGEVLAGPGQHRPAPRSGGG